MAKTIKIKDLIEHVNEFILNSDDKFREMRMGYCTLLEDILHKTASYAGFGYLSAQSMEMSRDGKTVGIIFDETPERNHVYSDDSRRRYRVKGPLRD